MRFRIKDKWSWNRWFAWHPVVVNCYLVWLEIVDRRYAGYGAWEYSDVKG